MIPGLEHAEFARYGVMHRNTFVCAPELLDGGLHFAKASDETPVYIAGQLSGTEGYCEAVMSGLVAALSVYADLSGIALPAMPRSMAFGALLAYATDPETEGYQPMHVNFGIMEPLEERIRNKQQRYAAYAQRGASSLAAYKDALRASGLI